MNYSLVGLTPEFARENNIGGNVEDIPSVDERINECEPLAGDERLTCWQELDK